MQLGMAPPGQQPTQFPWAQGLGTSSPSQPAQQDPSIPQATTVGGVMTMKSQKRVDAEEQTRKAIDNAAKNALQPVIQGLTGLIKEHWSLAKHAKLDVENAMIDAVRARAGRYSAKKEAELANNGGSSIYMMLFSSKARQAKALMSDVLIGSGAERPWTISPSPKPDIPPEDIQQIMQGTQQIVAQAMQSGNPLPMDQIRQLLRDSRDYAEHKIMQDAKLEADRCEDMLDDVLTEGGYYEAMSEFLDDMTTFKTAFIKGPVIQMENQLTWQPQADGTSKAVVTKTKKKRWERVDPFMVYPAPWSKNVQDAFLFERHRLSTMELSSMIGVDGYNDDSIRACISDYERGGLHEWLQIDTAKASAEGRNTIGVNRSELIDALQYWGFVSGKMLREWGMKGISDNEKVYPVECWQIGEYTIKCVINPDPLGRRPYYADGFSRIPGAFWHNSLYDLISDCVDMCNAAARALANNLGIASGPQVAVNVDRIAPGEDITEMYPWKIWQFSSDPMGGNQQPISFFQPDSNAPGLMATYEKFVMMADEYSGIPRYMTGTEGTPGAGRTASGLSMMVGNASKVIKAIVSSVDQNITSPLLTRLFDLLMQTDPKFDFRGDLQIVPRGALSLTVREAANQARMQFLSATANPIDMQIVGIEGRAAVLRETARSLDMNVDDVVPSMSAIKIKEAQALQQQQNAAQMQMQGTPQGPQGPAGPQPQSPAPQNGPQSGQVLMNGQPQTDHFSPVAHA